MIEKFVNWFNTNDKNILYATVALFMAAKCIEGITMIFNG